MVTTLLKQERRQLTPTLTRSSGRGWRCLSATTGQTAGKKDIYGRHTQTPDNALPLFRRRCTPSVEPDPPAIASYQSEEKPATEKEHDGAIHCKVLDMKVKIDFNDKRSKFIQLLSMDDEEEVNIQAKASSPVEANQEDTSKPQPPSPLIESSMEEKKGRNESDALKCTVSNTNGDIVDGASAQV